MEQGRELYLAPYKYGHGCILIHNTAFVSLHAACRYALRMKISEVRYVHTFRELVQLHFDSCARGHFYCLFGIFFFFVAMSCLYGNRNTAIVFVRSEIQALFHHAIVTLQLLELTSHGFIALVAAFTDTGRFTDQGTERAQH